MPVRDILCFCAVLLISSSFHKCAECALVIKPKDTFAVSGKVATLNCSSSVNTRGNIAWLVHDSRNYIYAQDELSQNVASYINVSDLNDGNCSLNITASLAVANRYICRELDSGNQAMAELTVLKSFPECTHEVKDGSVHIKCPVVYVGYSTPMVKCEHRNESNHVDLLHQTHSRNIDNNVITDTWSFIFLQKSYSIIICSTEFETTDRPKEIIAAYHTGSEKTDTVVYYPYKTTVITGLTACGLLGVAGVTGYKIMVYRNRKKKLSEKGFLLSWESVPINDLKPGDVFCYSDRGAIRYAIFVRVIDEETVLIICLREAVGLHDELVASVRKESINLERFKTGGYIYRVDYGNYDNCYSADEVIERAESMIGLHGVGGRGYHLFKNNCERFANWCTTGYSFSVQSSYVPENPTNEDQYRDIGANDKREAIEMEYLLEHSSSVNCQIKVLIRFTNSN